MRQLAYLIVLVSYFGNAQSKEILPYNYGKNGMEYIVKYKSGKTVIVSTFNSRPDLIAPISIAMFDYYIENQPKSGQRIQLRANGALVNGTCKITSIEKLTSIEFHYESVERENGITEVYVNPEKSHPTTSQTAVAVEE
ncbi:MAG: hypothetical protein RLZZ500_1517 [Bacteroidota bacterium]|jgi:hypothetical protein